MIKKSVKCPDCNISLEKKDCLLYYCINCGLQIKEFESITSFQNINRINNTKSYVYSAKGHFTDAIKKYQEKQNTNIPPKVITDIKQKIENYDIKL
jgi:hypothetical protein